MVVGDLDLRAGNEHAPTFDVPDFADSERDFFSGNIGAGRREHGFHAGACVGRAADNLDRLSIADIDHANPQAVGIWMLFGREH